jgi:hypothetical protein
VARNRTINEESEKWRLRRPCPSEARIGIGTKCSYCAGGDMVHPCLICDGTACHAASKSIKEFCKKSEAYVYIASFGLVKAKVGVAHKSRIPIRWIEQGANLAKRIIKGNGIEVRRIEKQIHEETNVLAGLRTKIKLKTAWKHIDARFEANLLAETEKEIMGRFPCANYCKDNVYSLQGIYSIPILRAQPIEIRIRNQISISGTILGAKGNLLFLEKSRVPYVLNLKNMLGKRIRLANISNPILQATLDRF